MDSPSKKFSRNSIEKERDEEGDCPPHSYFAAYHFTPHRQNLLRNYAHFYCYAIHDDSKTPLAVIFPCPFKNLLAFQISQIT